MGVLGVLVLILYVTFIFAADETELDEKHNTNARMNEATTLIYTFLVLYAARRSY